MLCQHWNGSWIKFFIGRWSKRKKSKDYSKDLSDD